MKIRITSEVYGTLKTGDVVEAWGFEGNEVIASGLAHKTFLEKETRENPVNFYKTTLARSREKNNG